MSYIVVLRLQLEGDSNVFKELMNNYKKECLANETGLEQFFISTINEDDHGFLLVQVFTDYEAHEKHSNGQDLSILLKSLEENNIRIAVLMMSGEEISETIQLLN